MKKYLILASAALLALAACNKESGEAPVINNQPSVLTFTSARPQLDVDTRTEWDAASRSVIWSVNDKIKVGFTFNGDWWAQTAAYASANASPNDHKKFYQSDEVVVGEDPQIGEFSVPTIFEGPSNSGKYVFYAVYPGALIENNLDSAPETTVVLKTTQTPGENTFDASTDIMVGTSAEIESTGLPEDPIEINWKRVVAHADLTFSNMDFDGTEIPNKITLTFNEETKVAGSFSVNIADGTIGTGSANEIVLEGNGLTANSNSINAWATVLPVSFSSLSVEIKTDKATYTRSITGLSKTFKQNARNTLTINMATADRMENLPTPYSLYSGDLTEGVYIIYDATDGVAMRADVENSRFKAFSITPTDDVILTDEESILWHIAPSGDDWTIYNSSSAKYAVVTGSNYNVALSDNHSDNKALWSVSGAYDFINKSNSKYLRYNAGYGFAGYASGTGHTLTLYKFDSREALAAPSSVIASLNQSVSNAIDVIFDDNVTDADTYVITATPTGDGDPVTLTGVLESPATIEGLAFNTAYVVSVYAVPASDDLDHKRSAATEAAEPVTTGAKPDAPEGYELISSVDDVTTGLYIIAAKVGDKYIGLPNTLGTSPFAGEELTVQDDVVLTSDASRFTLTITQSSNGYTITGASNTLGYEGSSTSFSISATGNAALWTISKKDIHGSFRIANVATTNRAVVYRAGTTNKFGAYSTSNITAAGEYYDVELFKFNGVIKDNPTTTVSPASPISLEVGGTQQLTVSTNSDGAVTYESSNTDIATVSNSGLITAVASGSATITVKTAATNSFNASSTPITVNVIAAASTISQITAAGTYTVKNAVVMATKSSVKNFIISDGTGNIVVYHSEKNHGFVVGDVVTVIGSVIAYGGVWEFSEPAVTKTGTAVPSYPTPVEYDAAKFTTYATTPVIEYGHAIGVVDGNNVTVADGKVLNVYGDLSDLGGKTVEVSGYSFGYNSNNGKINFMQVGTASEYVDPNAPSLSVSPATTNSNPASWPADNDVAKTFTVSATNGTWAITDASTVSGWANISTSGNVITVTPKVKQATEAQSGSIVITLTPSHEGYEAQTATIYLSQAKYGGDTIDWSLTYTSNVALPVSGTNVSSCKVIISGTEYDGTKLGKSGSGASANITIPAGTTKLYVHCASWNAKSASLSLSTTASGVTISPSTSWSLVSDSGISNNSPFTLAAPNKASTDYFKEYTLTGVNSDITIKIQANDERAVLWGVNAN